MSAVADASATREWLVPVGHGARQQARWTRLGTLDGPGEPIVDASGLVQVAPGRPGIDWWIAGDDRWYFPAVEPTVRQSLVQGTPVVETRMRIRGGDVCQRCYAMTVTGPTGPREVVVIEVENTTGVPCGLALAVRPFGVIDDTPIHRVEIDGGVVYADGSPTLVLPQAPAGALAGGAVDGDLANRVSRGEATTPTFSPLECPSGFAQAVVVVPMAHRTSFRAVVPVPDVHGRSGAAVTGVSRGLASPETVAQGWRTLVRSNTRVRVPDPRLQSVMDSAPTWLLATTSAEGSPIGRSLWDSRPEPRWDHVAAIAGALDRFGQWDRAGLLLARAASHYHEHPQGDGTWLVEAFAAHLERTGDVDFARAVVETCAQIMALCAHVLVIDENRWRRAGVIEAARRVCIDAGEVRTADVLTRSIPRQASKSVSPTTLGSCRELAQAGAWVRSGQSARAWATLDRYLDEVTATGVWPAGGDDPDRHAVGVGAAVASLVCDLLIRSDGPSCHLASHVPDGWYGSSFEAHAVATALGSAGFAVRWHGRRPAVLWEVSGSVGATGDGVDVDVLGLDAEWRGTGRHGEALLGEVEGDVATRPTGSRITGLGIGSPPRPAGRS